VRDLARRIRCWREKSRPDSGPAAIGGRGASRKRNDLPKVWGSGSSAAADGTKYDLAENSLLAE
jgi:hypothetical protein